MTTIACQDGRRAEKVGRFASSGVGTAWGGRRVLNRTIFAKSKCLSAIEALAVLAKTSHLTFACIHVFGGIHLDVRLGIASIAVFLEEVAVSTIQDIDLRIGKPRIELDVGITIFGSDVSSHDRGSVGRVLAMEDEESASLHRSQEQVGGEKVLVVIVDGSVDMASVVLVLEAAVNHHLLREMLAVLAVQDVQHSAPRDAGNAAILPLGEKMRYDGLVGFFHVHDGLESRGRRRGLLLGLHDVAGVLKHAERSSELFPGPHERVRRSPGVSVDGRARAEVA